MSRLADDLEVVAALLMDAVQPHLDEINKIDPSGGAGQSMIFALGYAQGTIYHEIDKLRKEEMK